MVAFVQNDADLQKRAWDAAARVVDPEIPVLTIADLGVLRDVAVIDGHVEVAITPTYSGCPAMSMIALEIELALEREGIRDSKIRTVLSPAWTTDWMSDDGRRKLKEYGIVPPQAASNRWRARNAAPMIPKCCPNSARPPARRCGAAGVAASHSTISSATSVIASEAKQSSTARNQRNCLDCFVALLLAMTAFAIAAKRTL
jgi:ring-1,2-phenylacetyl-CoA epoxidase subunit PaaD